MSIVSLNKDMSSFIIDYSSLNSFIQTNKFGKSLELYSIVSNISINNQQNIFLKILIKELFQEYFYVSLNEFDELFKIFEKNKYSFIN